MSRKGWLEKSSLNGKTQKILVTTNDHREYSIIVGHVYGTEPQNGHFKKNTKYQAVAVAYPSLHETIEVQARNRGSLLVQTFVNYTKTSSSESEVEASIPDLKVTLRETVKKVVQLSPNVLHQQHEASWRSLWWSGFSISHSHAPNAINGYKINATLYYLLCQRTMQSTPNTKNGVQSQFLAEISSLVDGDLSQTESYLFKPDRCYNGYSTLHVSYNDSFFNYELYVYL